MLSERLIECSGIRREVDVTQEDGAQIDLPSIAFARPERDAFESQRFTEEDVARAPTQPPTTVDVLGMAGSIAGWQQPPWIVAAGPPMHSGRGHQTERRVRAFRVVSASEGVEGTLLCSLIGSNTDRGCNALESDA